MKNTNSSQNSKCQLQNVSKFLFARELFPALFAKDYQRFRAAFGARFDEKRRARPTAGRHWRRFDCIATLPKSGHSPTGSFAQVLPTPDPSHLQVKKRQLTPSANKFKVCEMGVELDIRLLWFWFGDGLYKSGRPTSRFTLFVGQNRRARSRQGDREGSRSGRVRSKSIWTGKFGSTQKNFGTDQ